MMLRSSYATIEGGDAGWDHYINLTFEVKDELSWWRENLNRNLFAQRLGAKIHWLHPQTAHLLCCLKFLYLEQAKAGNMVHSWPGLSTHHLIFPDQHLHRAFEDLVKLFPTFEQKPDLWDFKALLGRRSFRTWIA